MQKKNVLDVSNKVILIFGGCGILGSEFGKHLLSENSKVCIADLSQTDYKKNFKDYIGNFKKNLIFSKVNVLNRNSVEKCLNFTLKKFKKIDVIINASAVNAHYDKKINRIQFSSIHNYPIKYWRNSLDVNLTGAYIISQVATKYFLKIKKGHLINIGSNYGLVAPDQSIYKENNRQKFYKPADYVVSKFGIIGLNKYLASYFRNSNIRFNLLTPSGIENRQKFNFKKKYSNKTLLNRMSRRSEFNGAIQFLCSDASSYMTGSNLIIDGGWTVI